MENLRKTLLQAEDLNVYKDGNEYVVSRNGVAKNSVSEYNVNSR